MPVNTIPGSGVNSPVELYKVRQTDSDFRQREASQRSSQQEDIYSVTISQEAIALQKQEREQQAESEQKVEQNRELRAQTDRDLQRQRAEAEDRTQQQAIDILI